MIIYVTLKFKLATALPIQKNYQLLCHRMQLREFDIYFLYENADMISSQEGKRILVRHLSFSFCPNFPENFLPAHPLK